MTNIDVPSEFLRKGVSIIYIRTNVLLFFFIYKNPQHINTHIQKNSGLVNSAHPQPTLRSRTVTTKRKHHTIGPPGHGGEEETKLLYTK